MKGLTARMAHATSEVGRHNSAVPCEASTSCDGSHLRIPIHQIAALAGVGLKHEHLDAIAADGPQHCFFEVHAENYMGAGGMPHLILDRIRRKYPISLHGVAMSIGGPQPINRNHLGRFCGLVERYEPALVSEHLAWSTHAGTYYNDLLPLPYTNDTLQLVGDHISEVQDAIKRPILLENPSTYVAFVESTMSETSFIREVTKRTGCGLLLDINNVFVSAANHGYSAREYLMEFPMERVGEIHLAGHFEQVDEDGNSLVIDSHDRPVADAVWQLFETIISQFGPHPTLIEWDNDVPEWQILKAELISAKSVLDRFASISVV